MRFAVRRLEGWNVAEYFDECCEECAEDRISREDVEKNNENRSRERDAVDDIDAALTLTERVDEYGEAAERLDAKNPRSISSVVGDGKKECDSCGDRPRNPREDMWLRGSSPHSAVVWKECCESENNGNDTKKFFHNSFYSLTKL